MPATVLIFIIILSLLCFFVTTIIAITEDKDIWWIPLLSLVVATSLIFWGSVASSKMEYTIKTLPIINQNDRQFIIIDDDVVNLTKEYNKIFDGEEITVKIPNQFSCGIQFDFTPIEIVDNLEDEINNKVIE